MPNALVDNSTLSAVQRLLGQAPAPSSYDMEGDYSAFEGFAQTLLFSDTLYALDDYKSEYRQSRKDAFSQIRFVEIDKYNSLEATSIDLSKDFALKLHGGDMPEGIVKDFLANMDVVLTAAWHLQSSDFFLTLKILRDEAGAASDKYKYSQLTAAIFHQLLGRNEIAGSPSPVLLDSSGDLIPDRRRVGNGKIEAVSDELIQFSNSINWLARRSIFYSLVASHSNAQLCLHPIRHNFLAEWGKNQGFLGPSSIWSGNMRRYFAGQLAEVVNEVNSSIEAQEIGLELPPFAAWAVGRTGKVSSAIEFLQNRRQDRDFVSIRQKIDEINSLFAEGDRVKAKVEINRLRAAIQSEGKKILKDYGGDLGSRYTISVSASLPAGIAANVSKELTLPNISLLHGQRRQFRIAFRSIASEIASFQSLGHVRQQLRAEVQRVSEFTTPALEVEESQYRYARPYWKKPM